MRHRLKGLLGGGYDHRQAHDRQRQRSGKDRGAELKKTPQKAQSRTGRRLSMESRKIHYRQLDQPCEQIVLCVLDEIYRRKYPQRQRKEHRAKNEHKSYPRSQGKYRHPSCRCEAFCVINVQFTAPMPLTAIYVIIRIMGTTTRRVTSPRITNAIFSRVFAAVHRCALRKEISADRFITNAMTNSTKPTAKSAK